MNTIKFIKENGLEAISQKPLKFDPIVRECRGLTIRTDTLEIVARSFDRFFNFGEDENKIEDLSSNGLTEEQAIELVLTNEYVEHLITFPVDEKMIMNFREKIREIFETSDRLYNENYNEKQEIFAKNLSKNVGKPYHFFLFSAKRDNVLPSEFIKSYEIDDD